MKPIKIAILSCNHGHGKAYYNINQTGLFEIVAVSVEKEYRDKVFLERLPDIPKYDTDEELYANHKDLEAVIIASANKKHFEQVKVATEKGLHIFSMKVPTFDMKEYDDMIELTEKANVVCQVELEMREHPEIFRIKELINSGKIGKPLSITGVNYSHNPVWWRPWQCNPEESYGRRIELRENDGRFRGGALADHPHVFDAIRFITDSEFENVFAEVAPNIRKGVETEDLIHVVGKLKNGMIFSIDPSYANDEKKVSKMVNWEKYPKCVEVTLNVIGTEGVIVADIYGQYIYHNCGETGEYMSLCADYPYVWNKRMVEFYNCIRYGKKPTIGLREHKNTIIAMNAAYESVSKQQMIKL